VPDRVVVILGTGTEVGKTFVCARLLRTLRAEGVEVAARKPAQSFVPSEGPTDAEVLAAETGQAPGEVCPPHRWYEAAMAPPMAAQVLGRPGFTIAELAAETTWSPRVEVGVVETAGGVRSPQADDGDAADLLCALGPASPVLVADAGLGALNSVRLCTDVLGPVPVLLNRYDGACRLHRLNLSWLESYSVDAITSVDELAARLV
jgi:dethiobiotin synthetase